MKYIRLFLLCLLLLIGFAVGVSAKSASVLIEAETLTVLCGENEQSRLPMASLTKVMTALVVLDNASLDEMVTVDSRSAGTEGSSMYLTAGQRVLVKDLLYGLMLVSGNDAAMALAFHVSDSIEEFAVLMNEKAKELQLDNTYFLNPSGLNEEGHFTSAYDFARLSSYALQNETFAQIVSSKTYKFGKTTLVNHNRLLGELEGCIGVKTGFTKASGRCLVSAVQRDGVQLICVTLNYSDDWNVHKKLYSDNFPRCQRKLLINEKEYYGALSVAGGHTAGYYNPDVYGVIIDGNEEYQVIRKLPSFIYADKQAGDTVGKILVTQNGKVLAQAPLLIDRDTRLLERKKSIFEKFSDFILHLFGFCDKIK